MHFNSLCIFGSSLFGVGRYSKQSAVLKNEGLIRNSGIACLAVAAHPLHQEKR